METINSNKIRVLRRTSCNKLTLNFDMFPDDPLLVLFALDSDPSN